jgi:predicted GNAT family N-acyltransferase
MRRFTSLARDPAALGGEPDHVTPVAGVGGVSPFDVRDPVHGVVSPADVRPGDPIRARVRRGGVQEVGAQVWRISPFGVELVRTLALASVVPGDALDLTVHMGTSVSEFRKLLVVSLREERGREILALRWSHPAPRALEKVAGEQRDGSRWSCLPEYLPSGITPNAVRLYDHVHFRIADISGTGMQLLTSLRNKFIIPGVTFEATCTFPTLGSTRVEFHVVHTRVVQHGGKKFLSVGTTYRLPERRAPDLLGQYLLQFGPGTSLQELRATGFRIRTSLPAVEFGSVRTDDEYREILALRRLAYVHAKKVSEDAKDLDMADEFDAQSRILFARYQGRMVASLRVMFPSGAADPLKHEEYVRLPETLPPRDELVELSKACTHPDFRGSDLFYGLAKLATLTIAQAGRRWMLMSCTDGLVRVYTAFGWRRMSLSYVHPSMKLEHHLLLGDVPAMLAGQGTNPIFWNLTVGREIWEFAKMCNVVPDTLRSRTRVFVWRLFKPLALLFAAYLRRSRRTRR